MKEFTAEDIQRAADEVRRGGFGDFMFSNPGQNHTTTRRRTSKRRTKSRRVTSRKNTSRRNTSRCCNISGWRNTSRGNNQMKSYWKDGNMCELKIRRRK
ncbi:MAG: hypothetical protein K6T88_21680 [Bacillus sp. (in: Bacteria)]|nr:hypothetical protein [Bacillus sp. (in: firmicutes)]